jgi:putative polyhydroxyalkanoate system protein
MGMMKLEVPHALSKDEARKRVEALLRYWTEKYGVQTTWNGDAVSVSGRFIGMSLHAQMVVGDSKVGGEASDPGLLFREKARQYLTRKFNDYLDPKGIRET